MDDTWVDEDGAMHMIWDHGEMFLPKDTWHALMESASVDCDETGALYGIPVVFEE